MAEGSWSHRPALDGVRTLAVYLVVVYHAGVTVLPGGFVGVDVFFVLSGYLVTRVMWHEFRTSGTISLPRFYARRVRRLLPAALVMIVSVCLVSVAVLPRLARVALIDDARASLLYVANWHFARDATDYFADSVESSPFLHMWSLAIEEQFYLVYPLLLLGLIRVCRSQPRRLPQMVGGLALLSLAAQLVVARHDQLLAYYGTHTRLYQLLAGAALALAWSPTRTDGRRSAGGRLAAVAAASTAIVGSSAVDVSPSTRGLLATATTLCLLVGLESDPRSRLASTLSTRPVTYLGRISYGTYLWHWPIVVLARPFQSWSTWQMLLLSGVGGTVLAALSHRVVEMPVRRARVLDSRPRTIVAAGLAIGLVCAVAVVGVPLRSDNQPVAAARRDPALERFADLDAVLSAPPPDPLDLAATEPPAVDLSACGAADPSACVLRAGGAVHVLLLGDSNADQLIPVFSALAETYDFTFSASTRMGCPWQEDLTWVAEDQRLIDDCVRTRPEWYGPVIESLEPDVVVVAGVPRDDRADGSVYVADASPGGVAGATERTARRIVETGARLVILEPLPYATFDPTVCLSGAEEVGECSFEPSPSPSATEKIYRDLDAASDDVVSVDLDAVSCPTATVCLPVLDGRVAFRNQYHLSNALLLARAERIWSAMDRAGSFDGVG